jgi:hypothetical protein
LQDDGPRLFPPATPPGMCRCFSRSHEYMGRSSPTSWCWIWAGSSHGRTSRRKLGSAAPTRRGSPWRSRGLKAHSPSLKAWTAIPPLSFYFLDLPTRGFKKKRGDSSWLMLELFHMLDVLVTEIQNRHESFGQGGFFPMGGSQQFLSWEPHTALQTEKKGNGGLCRFLPTRVADRIQTGTL